MPTLSEAGFWRGKIVLWPFGGNPQKQRPQEQKTKPNGMIKRVEELLAQEGFFDSIQTVLTQQAQRYVARGLGGGEYAETSDNDRTFFHHVELEYGFPNSPKPPQVRYTRKDVNSNLRLVNGVSYIGSYQSKPTEAKRGFVDFERQLQPGDEALVHGQAAIQAVVEQTFPSTMQSDFQIDGTYPYVAVSLSMGIEKFSLRFITESHVNGSYIYYKGISLEEDGFFKIYTQSHPERGTIESSYGIALGCINFAPVVHFLTEPIRAAA